MTPEEIQLMEELTNRVQQLETVSNTDAYEMWVDEFIKRKATVVDSDVTISTSIGMGGGTVNHLDFPDEWIQITYKGSLYRIPAYSESRFI